MKNAIRNALLASIIPLIAIFCLVVIGKFKNLYILKLACTGTLIYCLIVFVFSLFNNNKNNN